MERAPFSGFVGRASATAPQRRAEKRQERLERIVKATVTLAEEGGLSAVRSRAICERADVTMGMLYRHFGSIEEILLYAFAKDFEQLQHLFPKPNALGGDPVARVDTFFNGVTMAMVARPLYLRAVVSAVASGQGKALGRVDSLDERLLDLIESAWTGGAPSESGSQSKSRLVARTLERAWFTLMVGWAASVHGPDEVISELHRTAELLREGHDPS